jgi:hypothetical protein
MSRSIGFGALYAAIAILHPEIHSLDLKAIIQAIKSDEPSQSEFNYLDGRNEYIQVRGIERYSVDAASRT